MKIWVNVFVLAKSSIKILMLLSSPCTRKELMEKTSMPERTVRYAISMLKKRNLIIEKKMLSDMRKIIYEAVI